MSVWSNDLEKFVGLINEKKVQESSLSYLLNPMKEMIELLQLKKTTNLLIDNKSIIKAKRKKNRG